MKYSLLFLCVFFVCGCQQIKLRNNLSLILESKIELPVSSTEVYNGETHPFPDSLRSSPLLIIYIDSTECSTCRISRLIWYKPVFDLAEEYGNFHVVPLVTPANEKRDFIREYLELMDSPFPIYLDEYGTFRSDNPSIPDDTRFHSFLIDNNGKPLVVGDPMVPRILELYRQTIQTSL